MGQVSNLFNVLMGWNKALQPTWYRNTLDISVTADWFISRRHSIRPIERPVRQSYKTLQATNVQRMQAIRQGRQR